MSLTEYKTKNDEELTQLWGEENQGDWGGFESFCFSKWQESGLAEVAE